MPLLHRFYPYDTAGDGSRSSICLECFRTVRGSDADFLYMAEQAHLCEETPLTLRHYAFGDSGPAYRQRSNRDVVQIKLSQN